ncbi:MAG: undecaprenyl/decaprenyl-phosphate alpha-N-acetylglucosaminyl 1-phosphate transferase, partial [Firmicutes bacterium]|nr:undecaprenyl/decaprenyl-phosphate alpha-N-acetylglucosaminyl 1-phosphate transferase [Bacillota bacterium]
HRQAVLMIYAVSLLMGASAVIMNLLTTNQAMLLLVILATFALVAANKIGVTGSGIKKTPGKGKLTKRSSNI